MIRRYFVSIMLLIALFLSGCGQEKAEKPQGAESEFKTETTAGTSKVDATTTAEDEYPMPILKGWEEIEIAFKIMGDGKIELWSGEFSFEGPIEDYFESYQAALSEAGFEIEVTEDAEGFKTLEFEKTINGKKYVGNALFNDGWVKSGLQHFK